MAVNEEVRKFVDEVFVGVGELAAAAARILISTETYQDRETVTSLPDERTVRYYITEGLITPSEEKQGTSSVFSYLQLLQLLVIKKLQTDNLSIRQIRKIVANRNTSELEQLLDSKETSGEDKNDAQKFLESLLIPQPLSSIAPPSSLKRSQQAPPRYDSFAQQTSLNKESVWRRVEIAPGLEIHFEENFEPPHDARNIGRLLQKFQQLVESLRKGKK